jgi:ATP-dependent DNA helicase RecG
MTIKEIKRLRETEDRVEFKEAKRDFNFAGGSHADPRERRRCVLGYVVALANEGGGYLVFGVKEKSPNEVVGTSYEEGTLGSQPRNKRVMEVLEKNRSGRAFGTGR